MSIFTVADITQDEMAAVLAQFEQGTSGKEIADRLHISVEQVAYALIRQYPSLRRRRG